jgi:hypothetical protein
MSARGYALTLAAVLAALLGWLFHAQYTWVREEVRVGYQGEALDNDFLAAQRLLQRTGHPAASLRGLGALPAPGDVLILPRRGGPMAPPEAARITAWVASGGLLLAAGAEPEAPGAPRDALFRSFGVRVAAAPAPPAPCGLALQGATLRLDLGANTLQAAGSRTLAPTAPGERPEPPGQLLQRDRGRGRALLCTGLGCLDNDNIQRLDHADFLCAVAAQRPGGRVWIVIRDQAPSAWGWLWAHARPALAALAALLLAALWARAPRFGPPLPDPDPARRSFLEHLDASGRYQWRTGQGHLLLAASRTALLRRLGQAHPGWLHLDPEELARRLAQHAGLPPERIHRALHHPAATHAGFLEAEQTLHQLRRSL